MIKVAVTVLALLLRCPPRAWVSPPLPFGGPAQREAGSAPGLARVPEVSAMAYVQEMH